MRIRPAEGAEDLEAVRGLFRAYAEGLGIDLCFQDFEAELAHLPGKYAPPTGSLLVAGTPPVACVALRALSEETCEMKRLFVSPSARGNGLGEQMVDAILAEALGLGYRVMKLDTLPTLTAAIKLYERRGFVRTEAYYDTPVAGTLFFAKVL